MSTRPARARLTTILLTAPLVALLALTGCAGEDVVVLPIEPPPVTETDTADDGFPTACVTGPVWSLDVDDLAKQLLEQMQSQGSPVTSVTGSGEMSLLLAEDSHVNVGADVTFTMVMPLEGGTIAIGEYRKSGSGVGEWFWAADAIGIITFRDWEEDYDTTMTVTIEGATVVVPLDVPDPGFDATATAVQCDGGFLTTSSTDSPFSHRWRAVYP